ncbi:44750_t:CDS:2, partial [Gigaspora margarita]
MFHYKQECLNKTLSSESSKQKIDNIFNDIIEIGEDFISENSENSLENEKKQIVNEKN